jgi:hypothetical protein
MEEREIREKLNDWINNFVGKPNKLLNNWPPCPYARQALFSNLVEVIFKDSSRDLDSLITSNLYRLSTLDVLIFCIDPKEISATVLAEKVDILNQLLKKYDYVLLEDHPDNPEILNGVPMNFGECSLVLAQKLSKLTDASKQLEENGYYKHWPKENLDYVVNWRNK